jgi:phage terminase Nu1 subunit (DNA packaging protein)
MSVVLQRLEFLCKSGSEVKKMGKGKAEVPIPELEVGTGEFASIIGRSDRWVRELTKDKVLTQASRGKYKLAESIQAYIEHVSGGKEEDGKPRLVDHKTEHERIKSEKAALELARMRGELHRSEDVEAVMSDMLAAFRQKILSIPTRLAPQVAGIESVNVMKGHLTRAVHEALKELADYDPSKFTEAGKRADMDGK